MSKTYESPSLTDLGTVEDLTQTTIKLKAHVPGIDVTYNKDKNKVTIKIGNAGVKYISGGTTS
ncbi:MAG: lasso RiPP family leader peptide-containing protein [Solirubrobacteraceae bacterium]|nr:lasso RiPP family leader peptide-containing protein [Patulibacter sp.]